MSPNEYQLACEKTALYPGRGQDQGLMYTVLGLSFDSSRRDAGHCLQMLKSVADQWEKYRIRKYVRS